MDQTLYAMSKRVVLLGTWSSLGIGILYLLKISQKSLIAAQKKAWLSWYMQLGINKGKVSMILETGPHPNWHTFICVINSWFASFLNTLLSSLQLFLLLFILSFPLQCLSTAFYTLLDWRLDFIAPASILIDLCLEFAITDAWPALSLS